jgi:hypothetical protein
MSARPQVSPPSIRSGWRITGMIGRVIRFSSSVTWIGSTGWMLSTYWVLLECGASFAVAEVQIVLERQADQIGDRVLRLLGQLERARVLVRRRRCATASHDITRLPAASKCVAARPTRRCAAIRSLPAVLVIIGSCGALPLRAGAQLVQSLTNCSAHAVKALSTSFEGLRLSRRRLKLHHNPEILLDPPIRSIQWWPARH